MTNANSIQCILGHDTTLADTVNSQNAAQQNLIQLRADVERGWVSDMQRKFREEKLELEKKLADKEQECGSLAEECNVLAEEKTQLEKQLAGALRVLKEKSNQERGIRPKSRSGYILQRTEEQTERIVSYAADIHETIPVYRTVLQTCYGADIALGTVKDFVRHDLKTKIMEELSLPENIFVDDVFNTDPTVILDESDQKNYVYRMQLRYSLYRCYYEVTLYHTMPIGIIDPDLMPSLPESDKK